MFMHFLLLKLFKKIIKFLAFSNIFLLKMAPKHKLIRYLKKVKVKRISNLKIFHNGSIIQRVSNRAGKNISLDKEDVICLENLNETHLEILASALRERHWNANLERIFGTFAFVNLYLTGLNRKQNEDSMNKINTISYKTARLFSYRILNNESESLFDDNRGRFHRYNLFDEMSSSRFST